MDYEFLIRDLNINKSQKAIGTDKGLAKIGDGIVKRDQRLWAVDVL